MSTPLWPEWGADMPGYHPWHVWTSSAGAHHAGYLLDTVVGPSVETGQPMVYEVLRCEPCIAIHVVPLPEPSALTHYYMRTFYEHDKPEMIARYEADAAWWSQCMHGPLLDAAVRALDMSTELLTVLDIGAGPGLLARQAYARGWHTTVIEPSRLCAERLIGQVDTVWHDTLENYCAMQDTQGRYDLITLWETLEHMSSPEDTLLHIWDLLRPGGVLGLCVPNEYNALQYRAVQELRAPKWWLSPPQHLFYWTTKTLQLQLRRAGYTLVEMRGTYPIEQHLLLGDYYVGNDEVGRRVHRERMQSELATVKQGLWPHREAQYRDNLHTKNIGREIIAIAQKP